MRWNGTECERGEVATVRMHPPGVDSETKMTHTRRHVPMSEGADGDVVVKSDVVATVYDKTPLVGVVDDDFGYFRSVDVSAQMEVYRLDSQQ